MRKASCLRDPTGSPSVYGGVDIDASVCLVGSVRRPDCGTPPDRPEERTHLPLKKWVLADSKVIFCGSCWRHQCTKC